MKIFWNKEGHEKINGQDVIGLRRIDQSIEKEWVAGITTISQRAKYISMLVWGLAEAYKIMPVINGSKQFDEKLLNLIFSRIEFIVLATSKWHAYKYEGADDFGLLGADVHKKEIDQLFETGSVQVPEGKNVGLIGTYYVTSSMFGLVYHDSESVLPITITPRGKILWEAIETNVSTSNLKKVILKGGNISTSDIESEGHFFSANQINKCDQERKLLEEAFTIPVEQSGSYANMYTNLRETLAILKEFGSNSTNAEDIILLNYKNLKIESESFKTNAKISWAEYEARRRIHFALELFLYRVSTALIQHGPLQVGQIIDIWTKRLNNVKKENQLFNFSDSPLTMIVADYLADTKKAELDIEEYIHFRDYENEAASVLSGLTLIFNTYFKFHPLILNKIVRNQSSIFEAVFDLIEKSKSLTVAQFLEVLILQAVVYPHISNTLRKMANGAKCSLRLYSDGNQIYPTGVNPYPGRSGTRLFNVINLFVDIGCIDRDEYGLKVMIV